jgi:allantoinase
VPYSAIVDRPPLEWPDGARIALWVSPNVEYYELHPPPNEWLSAWRRVPPPDVFGYAQRDYGNRVGFWRLLEVLDRHGIRATASVNTCVLDRFPEVGEAMAARDWAIMGHGIVNTRFLYGIAVEEERALFGEMIETVQRRTGLRMRGFFGPYATLSPQTMELAAEAGLVYSADWFLDDQPFPIKAGVRTLVGVPYSFELNDGPLFLGVHEWDEYERRAREQFEVLHAEGGRVMCLALHTWLFGRPHRARRLDELLAWILGHDGVWVATADEIAAHYLARYA